MLLEQLSKAFGVSGDETAVRRIVLDAIKDHVTDIYIDALGNVTALKQGTGEQRMRVMVTAHMDEVGFMVTGFDSNGTLRFTNVGGIDDRILPGLRVRIGKDALPGVILWPPIHKNKDQTTKKMADLRIDVGASGKNGAENKIKRGERIAFDSDFTRLSDTMIRGKAFDDRVGCALLIDILQAGPYPVDIVAAFTVQEEIGLRGARVAAQRLNPDMALALEGTTAHDVPDPDADPDDPNVPNPACVLGKGPVLTVMDRRMITPPHLLKFLRQTAAENDIPYQIKTANRGGTDAGIIHISNAGIPSATVSVPCRYIHSPRALMNTDDYDNTLKLLQAVLNAIQPEAIQIAI